MSATGCKMVFLTGTPIINYPNEIGVMFNMLRGYIKTFIFRVNVGRGKTTQKSILLALSQLVTADYIQYDGTAGTITITRNPLGFVANTEGGVYKGVKRNKGGNVCDKDSACEQGFVCGPDNNCIEMSDNKFIDKCIELLKVVGIHAIVDRNPEFYKALPDELETFNAMFINPETRELINEMVFQKTYFGFNFLL